MLTIDFKSKYNESLGILKWTKNRYLLSNNIDKLIDNNNRIILSELIPSELTDNIDPEKLLKIKSSLLYIPPQILKEECTSLPEKKYLIISESKSPNLNIYKILNENDEFDFLEINSQHDALKDLSNYEKIIIDLDNPPVTHLVILKHISSDTILLLTNRCISVIPRLVANGILLNVCIDRSKSVREFISKIISYDVNKVSLIDEDFFHSVTSFKDYKDVESLKLNNSYNNLTCFSKVLNHYPFIDKNQFSNKEITYPPKISSYENMGLWCTATTLLNSSISQKQTLLMLHYHTC